MAHPPAPKRLGKRRSTTTFKGTVIAFVFFILALIVISIARFVVPDIIKKLKGISIIQ